MPPSRALPTSRASIPSRREPATVHFCSLFVSHPLPSAHPQLRSSFRTVTPLSTAFTPNRPLTPLSTAFTQTHRGVGAAFALSRHSSLANRHFPRPLFSYSYELLPPEALYFHNHPHCPRVSPVPVDSSPRITGHESQVTSFQILAHSLSLLQLFFKLPSFVFNRLRTLRQKNGAYRGRSGIPYLERRIQGLDGAVSFPGAASFAV
jgi:hypothetical protein